MADVRALLRSERAVRRISHPQAQYSSSGALSCRVCLLPLKAESLWELHIRSKQHKINGQKWAESQGNSSDVAADVKTTVSNSRKRKAGLESGEERELPKAQKLTQLPSRASSHTRVESDKEPQNNNEEIEPSSQAGRGSQLQGSLIERVM